MIIVMRYGGSQDFMVILRPTKGRKHGLYLSPSKTIIKSHSSALETLIRLLVVLRKQIAILDKPDRWIDFVGSYITVLSRIWALLCPYSRGQKIMVRRGGLGLRPRRPSFRIFISYMRKRFISSSQENNG